jgi:hypothetical protein
MKTITIKDTRKFRRIVDVCNDALGLNYHGCQKSFFTPKAFKKEYGRKYMLWCTREHVSGKAALSDYGWVNKLCENGEKFIEYNEYPEVTRKYINNDEENLPLRVGFMYFHGGAGFKFIGVFKYIGMNEKDQRVYERIADRFPPD